MRALLLSALVAVLPLASQDAQTGQQNAPAPLASNAVTTAPLAPGSPEFWPKEVPGSVLYSLAAGRTGPASLHLRDASGADHLIALGSPFGQSGSPAEGANAFGPFAMTPDGQKVIYCAYRVFVPPQAVIIPTPMTLVTALGAAISSVIVDSMIGRGEIRELMGIYAWDRASGEPELLWDAKALKAQSVAWSKRPDAASLGEFDLAGMDLNARNSQILWTGGSSFLLVTPRSVIKLDAQAKTLTPVWADDRMNSTEPLMMQDGKGSFRVVLRNRILCVDPSEGVRMSEPYQSPYENLRVAFRGPDTVYFTDGKKVRKCALQPGAAGFVTFKEISTEKMKNDLVIPEASGGLLAIRQSAHGESTLTKQSPEGVTTWTANIGPSRGPVMISENGDRLYVLLCQPTSHGDGDVPLRVVLDLATGAFKDMDNWQTLPASVKEGGKVPLGVSSVSTGENWSGSEVVWLPAVARAMEDGAAPGSSWKQWQAGGQDGKRALDPKAGAWAVVNPDLTATPLAVMPRGEQAIRLTSDGRELYYTSGMGWFGAPR